jgi:general secretion pathway protein D
MRFQLVLCFSLLLGISTINAPATAWAQSSTVTEQHYPLQHRPLSEALQLIEPLLADYPDCQLGIDSSQQRLRLRGPQWAHDIVQQTLDAFDRPVPQTSSTPRQLVIYPTGGANPLQQAQQRLREQFAPGQVAISADQQSGWLYVRATPDQHRAIQQWLPPQSDRSPRPNSPPNTAANQLPASRAAADEQAIERRFVPVPPGQSQVLRQRLMQLIGDRLSVSSRDPQQMRLETASGGLTIRWDGPAGGEMLVEGPRHLVAQWTRLIDSLSRSGLEGDGQRQQVLILQRQAQPRLQQILDAPAVGRPGPRPNDTEARRSGSRLPVQPVLFSRVQEGSLSGQPPADAGLDDAGLGDAGRRPPQFEGIEIEMLPDLDAIILRGRDAELDELADIIRQLEEISRQTRPEIELLYLRHTGSQRLAELITQTQTDYIGLRQGRATIRPLAKPNALLLIGWGEAVEAIKELVEKLDQPVAPETQFAVIRLQHAVATTVQQTLQGFFANRGDLGPLIQSSADTRTNSIIVHAAPRDMQEVRRLIEQIDVPNTGRVQRAKVIPIVNALAADVAATLTQTITGAAPGQAAASIELLIGSETDPELISGILENTQITVNARNNSLIVSTPPKNLPLIEALIEQLDQPGETAKIKIFPIEYGDATSLVETLQALIPSQIGSPTSLQLGSAPGESSLAPLRFTVDARSNSIIATGSDGDLRIVEALVFRLDESDTLQRRNTVYQLKNSPAVDVALAINEFLLNQRLVEQAGPGTVNPFQRLEKEVVVVPEPVANKLILSATNRYYNEILDLIERLDEQPAQVMIQVLIAEVTLSDAEEFGVELGIQDSVLFDRSLLGDLVTVTQSQQTSTPSGIVTDTSDLIIAADNQPGFNFNNLLPLGNSGSNKALENARRVGGQGLSNFDVGRGNAELGFGGLVLSASSANLSILLRALQESRRMEVLSRPQILTLDNQPAFIQVGQRYARVTGASVGINGQQTSVEEDNVGLIVGVTPRINPEGNVVIEIDAEKSELGPESEGIPVAVSLDGTPIRSPRVDTATAQATVSAASGETIVLGGLITRSRRTINRKVPLLGDLPVLKHLFRYDFESNRRTELLIILTPHVIRSMEDAERLKQTEIARMNWCAADVYKIHGDLTSAPQLGTGLTDQGDWEVIYPAVDPRGGAGQRPARDPQPDRPTGPIQPAAPLRSFPSYPEELNLQGASPPAAGGVIPASYPIGDSDRVPVQPAVYPYWQSPADQRERSAEGPGR